MSNTNDTLMKNFTIAIKLLISLGFLFLIYWFPPAQLNSDLRFNPAKYQTELSSEQVNMIIDEHTKVANEILNRNEDTTNWYYYKFILIGALMAGILAYGLNKEKNGYEFYNVITKKIFMQ